MLLAIGRLFVIRFYLPGRFSTCIVAFAYYLIILFNYFILLLFLLLLVVLLYYF